MEDWQREIVVTNMNKLVKNTVCDITLLTALLSSNILSEEDLEELMGLKREPKVQAYKLYSILQKREHGFKNLLQGLRNTNQTGALHILTQGGIEDKISITYDENSVLGRGSYGTVVYKGKLGDKDIAVKKLHLGIIDVAQASHEIAILKACDSHENIVGYFGSKTASGFILILLELCDITLKEWVRRKTVGILPMEILRQVTVGLEWLHSQNIVHRDLKPENILLVKKVLKVKISDFGLSRRIVDGTSCVSTSVLAGTPGWVAPEILAQLMDGDPQHCKFTCASDVFALGCVYYYVITDGRHAFGDQIRCQANILDGNIKINLTHVLHCCVQNTLFIRLMISKDSKSRPSCSTLLASPLFWPESRCVDFLQQLLTENICSKATECFLQSKWIGPCATDHGMEVKLLYNYGLTIHKTSSCVVPNAYLQCRNSVYSLNISKLQVSGLMSDEGKRLFYTCQNMDEPPSKYFKFDKGKSIISSETYKDLGQTDRVAILFEVMKTANFDILKQVFDEVGITLKIKDVWDENMKSLLHVAAINRDHSVFEYLVNKHGFKDVLNKERFKTIVHYCMRGIHRLEANEFEEKFRSLRLLFNLQPELSISRDEREFTPLHMATHRNFKNGRQLEFIQFLIQNKADINAMDDRGGTPLHYAIIANPLLPKLLEIVQLLIEHGADPDSTFRSRFEQTTLHLAAIKIPAAEFHKVVLYLASIGRTKSFTATDDHRFTVLHHAVRHMEPLQETLKIFKSHGVDFNSVDNRQIAILTSAIANGGSSSFLTSLCSFGADWRKYGPDGKTVLHYAARNGNLPAVKMFISIGVNVNARNNCGDTPLILALKENKSAQKIHEIVMELVKCGADVNIVNNENELPLTIANRMLEQRYIHQCTVDLLNNA